MCYVITLNVVISENGVQQSLALIRNSLKSSRMELEGTHFDGSHPHVFVVFGASVRFFSLFFMNIGLLI